MPYGISLKFSKEENDNFQCEMMCTLDEIPNNKFISADAWGDEIAREFVYTLKNSPYFHREVASNIFYDWGYGAILSEDLFQQLLSEYSIDYCAGLQAFYEQIDLMSITFAVRQRKCDQSILLECITYPNYNDKFYAGYQFTLQDLYKVFIQFKNDNPSQDLTFGQAKLLLLDSLTDNIKQGFLKNQSSPVDAVGAVQIFELNNGLQIFS